MESIYKNEEVMKVLSVSLDGAINSMNTKVEPIERPINEISTFIRFLSTSYKNDDLLFLHSLITFLIGWYVTIKGGLEIIRGRRIEEGRKEKDIEEIDAKIDEIDKKASSIFLDTLYSLRDALSKKDEKYIIDALKKSHITMSKEIVDKYGYL